MSGGVLYWWCISGVANLCVLNKDRFNYAGIRRPWFLRCRSTLVLMDCRGCTSGWPKTYITTSYEWTPTGDRLFMWLWQNIGHPEGLSESASRVRNQTLSGDNFYVSMHNSEEISVDLDVRRLLKVDAEPRRSRLRCEEVTFTGTIVVSSNICLESFGAGYWILPSRQLSPWCSLTLTSTAVKHWNRFACQGRELWRMQVFTLFHVRSWANIASVILFTWLLYTTAQRPQNLAHSRQGLQRSTALHERLRVAMGLVLTTEGSCSPCRAFVFWLAKVNGIKLSLSRLAPFSVTFEELLRYLKMVIDLDIRQLSALKKCASSILSSSR